MARGAEQVLTIFRNLQSGKINPYNVLGSNPSISNQLINTRGVSVEDLYYGDSGKGSVVAKLNRRYRELGNNVVSMRYNGGANAGHETSVGGISISTHLVPTGLLEEGVRAGILQGVVLHPSDLIAELVYITNTLGDIPGHLFIDPDTILSLDTHRAKEVIDRGYFSGTNGATGTGIADAYADFYARRSLSLRDLMSDDWRSTISKHYDYYRRIASGFDYDIAEIEVPFLNGDKREKRKVGSLAEFIERLGESRTCLKPYVQDGIKPFLEDIRRDKNTVVTFESAQGIGLDPWHGIRDDVTASRPASRFIIDATHGVFDPENDLDLRFGAFKSTYLTTVGTRNLPTTLNDDSFNWIESEFNEVGRTTKRRRKGREISIPIGSHYARVAGIRSLIATHGDASRKDEPINVITHYTLKDSQGNDTGQEIGYDSHQRYLDQMVAHAVEFPGWDGEEIKQAQRLSDLDPRAAKYYAFIGLTIRPIAMITTGKDVGDYMDF